MDIFNDKTLYGTLEQFRERYLIDFAEQTECKSLLSYLINRKQSYDALWELMRKDLDTLLSQTIRDDEFKDKYIKLSNLKDNNDRINDFINIEIAKQRAIIYDRANANNSQQTEKTEQEETPEPYQKETGRGKNIPYKLALLKELKILDTLNIQYSHDKEQLYRILEYLTGGNAKNYYLSMYGDDYNGKDRVTHAHYADLRNKGLI